MPGTFLIEITEDRSSKLLDLRHRFMWSAWLDGTLLGKGHASHADLAIEQAHDLVNPDRVERIEIVEG
ncbi:MAG: hypothetical protein KKA32_04990 [Actinobacteria bacterium]|nr:hypothetical protein [Actinomycetota bacterium]